MAVLRRQVGRILAPSVEPIEGAALLCMATALTPIPEHHPLGPLRVVAGNLAEYSDHPQLCRNHQGQATIAFKGDLMNSILSGVVLGWVLRRPLSRAKTELVAAKERVLIPPFPAKFTSASWFWRPRGDEIIALTENALKFWPLLGHPISIPREEIRGTRLVSWFRGYRRAGCRHLILELSGGRHIAFIVDSPEEWGRKLSR